MMPSGPVRPGDGTDRGSRKPSWAKRLRVASGIVLVVAFALRDPGRSALMMAGLMQSGRPDADPVRLAERRFRRVVETLPPRGVFGYRARGSLKIGRNHELEGDDRSITAYVIAQYVLAPRVLDLGPAPRLVIRDDLEPARVTAREEQ